VPTKTGQKRWFNVSIIPVLDDDGQPRAVLHLFRDIQAKKKAEAFAMQVANQARHLELTPGGPVGNAEEMGAMGKLTPREDEILRLLARGIDTGGIAAELMISRTTVRNHIQHILHKLGVHSRLEAIAYAHRRNVIEIE
jgi:DNA-binding NarL/FixJ family response regulator